MRSIHIAASSDTGLVPFAQITLAKVLLWTVGACLWFAAMLATLSVSQLDFAATHSICGPWGCGPKIEALIACHGFWLLLLSPSAALAARASSIGTIRLVSFTAIGAGVAGLLGVIALQSMTYLAMASRSEPSYLVQRWLFVVATTIEFPMIQLLLLGLAGWWYAVYRRRSFLRAQRPAAFTHVSAK